MRWNGWILALALAGACGGGGGGGSGAPFGLTQRQTVTSLTFPNSLPTPGSFDVVEAFPSLTFASPTFLTHAPDGTDRIFVVEREGRIRVFPNDELTATSQVFLDIRGPVITGGERGLLGMAFEPNYAANGYFYLYYSASTPTPGMDHRSFVARYQVSAGDPDAADPTSETILLTVEQPYSNHNGGAIAFGADGMLYVALGDGGSAGDPDEVAQDLTSLLGKILRLTPGGGIPPDNPFVGQGGGVREEIWAYGLRNPWRFGFDRNNGDLWCGDVGQGEREEIDLIERGGNYGWDLFEGTRTYENPGGVPFASTIAPVHEYDHGLGRAVVGGYVYRGTANASLTGAYVYADYVTGRIWALVHDGVQVVSNDQIGSANNPTSFGEDEAGELYICSSNGRIYRLEETSGGPTPPFPQLLSDTGLFTDTANLVPAPGVVEYGVNAPLWSDDAGKRRWIALPGVARIAFDPVDAWGFPVDTVLVKHFEIETAPGQIRRLETRVLIHEGSDWQGYTYKWNAQGSDADLLPGADSETFTVLDPTAPGGQRQQTWNFPARADCLVCHTLAAGRVLGIRTRQLNGDFDYPAVTDNQLRAWNHIDLFTIDLGDPSLYDALPSLDDPAASTADRARAYLASNCANCHLAGGPTPVSIDLRYGITTTQMNAIFVAPSAGDLGLINPYIIAPGSKETSVLWERMRLLDGSRMPPLGSNLVHQAGVDTVGQWIDDGAN